MPFNFQALCFAVTHPIHTHTRLLTHTISLPPFMSFLLSSSSTKPPVCLSSFFPNWIHPMLFCSRCFTLFTIFVYFSVAIMWFFSDAFHFYILLVHAAKRMPFHSFICSTFIFRCLFRNIAQTETEREAKKMRTAVWWCWRQKYTYADERAEKKYAHTSTTKWRNKNRKGKHKEWPRHH